MANMQPIPQWTNYTPHVIHVLRPLNDKADKNIPVVCQDGKGMRYGTLFSCLPSGKVLRAVERRAPAAPWSFTFLDPAATAMMELPSLAPPEFVGLEELDTATGAVRPLPAAEAAALRYSIVSMVTAPLLVAAGAQYVAVPDTSPESAVRDANGCIQGVRGMVCYPPIAGGAGVGGGVGPAGLNV